MKRTKILIAMALVFVMVTGVLAGCAPKSAPAAEATPAPTAEVPAVDAPTAPAEEPADENSDISLYFLLKTLANPFWVSMKEGIEEAAAAAGVKVFVDAMNSEDELGPQLDKMIASVNGDYNGMGIAPISGTNLIEGVVAANQKGIPVYNIDEAIDAAELASAGAYVAGYAATDNVAVGKKGADFIVEQIGEGQVAIIEGKAGAASGEARVKGATEAFTAAAGIELVDSQPADWDRNKALDVATNIIQQYPEIKAFYCANDTMALGVQEAVENANLQDVCIVVGTDGVDDAVASIKEGRLTATVAQDPKQVGATAFAKLLQAVKDGNAGSADAELAVEYVDSILITKDNA